MPSTWTQHCQELLYRRREHCHRQRADLCEPVRVSSYTGIKRGGNLLERGLQ